MAKEVNTGGTAMNIRHKGRSVKEESISVKPCASVSHRLCSAPVHAHLSGLRAIGSIYAQECHPVLLIHRPDEKEGVR